jgi:hypothetical protein
LPDETPQIRHQFITSLREPDTAFYECKTSLSATRRFDPYQARSVLVLITKLERDEIPGVNAGGDAVDEWGKKPRSIAAMHAAFIADRAMRHRD